MSPALAEELQYQTGAPSNTPPPEPKESGWILPYSIDQNNSAHFDPNAGAMGLAKRAIQGTWSGVTLPSDVMSGRVDPSSPEAIARSAQMATLAMPVNPMVRAGDAAIPAATFGRGLPTALNKMGVTTLGDDARVRPSMTPPTADVLHDTADAEYQAARDMDVHYHPLAVADMAATAQRELESKGAIGENAPQAHAILNKLQVVPRRPSAVPLVSLDAARQRLGEITGGTDEFAAGIARRAIDDFVNAADPATVVSGPAADAAATIRAARSNYAAGMRSDAINAVQRKADLQAASANSGANEGNAMRQRIRSLVINPSAMRGFSPEETAALESVPRGTLGSNSARVVGNVLGGGGGMHTALTGLGGGVVGGEAGGPFGALMGATLPLVGVAAKQIDNRMTAGRLNAADELIRGRSALHQGTLYPGAEPVMSPATPAAAMGVRGAIRQQMQPSDEETAPPIQTDGRVGRRDGGGAVKPKPSHAELVDRLMARVEHAKKAIKAETKPIMNVPDNVVVHALAVAQRTI